MGIQADNAHELVVTFEAMAHDMRESARELAASIARVAPRPLSDFAQAVVDAKGQEAMEKALEALEDESRIVVRRAGAAWRRHGDKGDTTVGNFREALSKALWYRTSVQTVGDQLTNAGLHDLVTQEFRNMEKGFREAGL